MVSEWASGPQLLASEQWGEKPLMNAVGVDTKATTPQVPGLRFNASTTGAGDRPGPPLG